MCPILQRSRQLGSVQPLKLIDNYTFFTIGCLTQVWQALFHPNLASLFEAQVCVCTFKHTFHFHLKSAKMLILLIRSHCKMCRLLTIQSCVFVLFGTDRHARCNRHPHIKYKQLIHNKKNNLIHEIYYSYS